MRAVLLILILAVVALIVAFATGFLDVTQTRPARVPDVDASREGITATGGQTPTFDVETGTVSVGAQSANVTVPVPQVEVNPPNQQEPAANSANAAQ